MVQSNECVWQCKSYFKYRIWILNVVYYNTVARCYWKSTVNFEYEGWKTVWIRWLWPSAVSFIFIEGIFFLFILWGNWFWSKILHFHLQPSWYCHTLLWWGVPHRIRCIHYPQGLWMILVCPGLECVWPSSNACRLSLGIVMMSKAPGGDGNPTANSWFWCIIAVCWWCAECAFDGCGCWIPVISNVVPRCRVAVYDELTCWVKIIKLVSFYN